MHGRDRTARRRRGDRARIAVAAPAGQRAGPVLARRLPLRHDRQQGDGARRLRRASAALRSPASTIPATASRAATSTRARSAAGSRKRWPSSRLTDGAAGRHRLVDGRLAGAAADPRAARYAATSRVKALILIAPAVDMTEDLMRASFTPQGDRRRSKATGFVDAAVRLSASPIRITAALIEDGGSHLLFGRGIDTGCPVTILQGAQRPRRAQGARAEARAAPAHRPGDLHADPRRRPPAEPGGRFAIAGRGGGSDGWRNCLALDAPGTARSLRGADQIDAPRLNPVPLSFDYRPPTEPWLNIVYEDERLIVLDKPSGLLTVPGKDPSLADSLDARVQARYPSARAPRSCIGSTRIRRACCSWRSTRRRWAFSAASSNTGRNEKLCRAGLGRDAGRERPHRPAARDRLGEQAAPARRS